MSDFPCSVHMQLERTTYVRVQSCRIKIFFFASIAQWNPIARLCTINKNTCFTRCCPLSDIRYTTWLYRAGLHVIQTQLVVAEWDTWNSIVSRIRLPSHYMRRIRSALSAAYCSAAQRHQSLRLPRRFSHGCMLGRVTLKVS
jgi:hypothetical protein